MNTQTLRQRRQQRDITLLEIAGIAPSNDKRVGVLAVLDTESRSISSIVERGAPLARSLGCGRLDLVGVAASGWCAWDGLSSAHARLTETLAGSDVELPVDLEIQAGSVTAVAIAAGLRRRPELVILGADTAGNGQVAVSIANALECPVLVMRGETRSGPIVAATKMAHLRYPVLASAARLARAFSKPATFLHNAVPQPFADVGAVGVRRLADEAAMAKHARLRTLAGWAGTEANAIVVRSSSILDAVIDVAVRQDADVVSIGSRLRTWFEPGGDSVAIDIVDRCPCSVLVVPMVRA